MNPKVSFLQIESSKLENAPIVEGQIVFTTDTNKLYRDINGQRINVSGTKTVISSQEPTNLSVGDLWLIETVEDE